MSLSIQYTKNGRQLEWQLSFAHAIAFCVLIVCLAVLIVSSIYRNTSQTEQPIAPVNQSRIELAEQKEALHALKARTEVELAAVKLKLSELQSYALRMNALGARLAENASLHMDEFNFADEPATGGPLDEQPNILENVVVEHELLTEMSKLLDFYNKQEQQLSLLESVIMNHHISDQVYVSGRPIKAGWLSSYYGMRKDPFSGLPAMHKGIDFAGKEGNTVIATGAGVVTWADERYGYGKLVEVDHGQGLKTRYGHNKELLVSVGDVVSKGAQIAVMGSTGRSTGPHVHYEILKNGKQIDPLKYVYRRAK
ncbi:M23/M37 peptidase domain-containing protein [Catenovulum agarivorans DS-2]|uniref:M23/M37 peptidase domain-containing protein n=1 Tax=Catenovulum agarivorans DS-2 TaxID=1328313 RepID=W7QE98_9ALTE|nr:M23 family metallopeptidase [Catenovulum agarivorans]EWH11209.1 M23/M37 peptidase domain-containing protein [Catenovulum agarivorans DS-2]